MTTLYENQLHEPIGPFASFFCILDKKKQGFLTPDVLYSFILEQSADLSLSFVQKKYLMLLIKKGLTKIQPHPEGHITIEDILCYAQRLLTFFCGSEVHNPQQCLLLSQEMFRKIGPVHQSIRHSQLCQHITQKFPALTPNKRILAHILTQILLLFCSQTKDGSISEKRWTDTALALYFELYNHR